MSTAIRGSTSKPTSKFDESSTLALRHTDTPCPRTGEIFTKNDQPRLVSNVSSAHCSWPQHILPRNKTHNHLRNVSPFFGSSFLPFLVIIHWVNRTMKLARKHSRVDHRHVSSSAKKRKREE